MSDKFEKEVTHSLTEGEMRKSDPNEEARDRLSPKYEIRIKAEHDPISEETHLYRSMAKEVDSRYDNYVNKAANRDKS